MACKRIYCNRVEFFESQVAVEDNFYTCVSFVTLRQELFMVQKNIEIYDAIMANILYLPMKISQEALEDYMTFLQKRRAQIRDQIRIIGYEKLGFIADSDSALVHLISQLNDIEKRGELSDSKIKDELQSYDIIQND